MTLENRSPFERPDAEGDKMIVDEVERLAIKADELEEELGRAEAEGEIVIIKMNELSSLYQSIFDRLKSLNEEKRQTDDQESELEIMDQVLVLEKEVGNIDEHTQELGEQLSRLTDLQEKLFAEFKKAHEKIKTLKAVLDVDPKQN